MTRGITKGLPIVIKSNASKEADDHDQTATIFLSPGRDVERPGSLDRPLSLIFIRWLGRRVEESHDRGAIEPQSWFLHHGINPRSSDGICLRIGSTIDARSWPDRGPIVAKIVAILKQKSWQNCGSFNANPEATTPLNEDNSHDASIPLHDRVNWPRPSG